jgi:dihydrofolate reductase
MGKLVYISNISLDGYIEGADGNFDFTDPDDGVFAFMTELIRNVDTYLYGRRLYEAMAVWETMPELAAQSDLYAEFARVWQAPKKVVYSTSLETVLTQHARIERAFDADAVRALKASAAGDITVGGANLAAQVFAAGLVDECRLMICPTSVGAGKPALPTDLRIGLELLDERRFDNGNVYVRYRVTS